MPRARSIPVSALVAFAAIGAAACGRNVNLGAIGDGGASLLWTATFEPGNLSEWVGDGMGGTYTENVNVFPVATTAMAHRGQYAGIVTVSTPMGMPMGMVSINYLLRNQPSPREAYYSAWYYIPGNTVVRGYLSLSHFRCSLTGDGNELTAIWDVNLIPRLDGSLVAQLYNYVTQTNVGQPVPTPVLLATWVHFEVYLRKATDATGQVTVWQDGVMIINNPNVVTAPTDWVQWDTGAASTDILPTPAVIYVDDAAISLSRVGAF